MHVLLTSIEKFGNKDRKKLATLLLLSTLRGLKKKEKYCKKIKMLLSLEKIFKFSTFHLIFQKTKCKNQS